MSRVERQQQRAKARKSGLRSNYRPPKTAQEALDMVRALEREAEDLRLKTVVMDARRVS